MKESDAALLKRLGWGCVAIAVLFAGLILVAARTGYLRVEQDLSYGAPE